MYSARDRLNAKPILYGAHPMTVGGPKCMHAPGYRPQLCWERPNGDGPPNNLKSPADFPPLYVPLAEIPPTYLPTSRIGTLARILCPTIQDTYLTPIYPVAKAQYNLQAVQSMVGTRARPPSLTYRPLPHRNLAKRQNQLRPSSLLSPPSLSHHLLPPPPTDTRLLAKSSCIR